MFEWDRPWHGRGKGVSARENGDTREQFLASARHLFAEKGFYGTSIAAIAGDIGLTKQALLHHFGSKERLYGEVLQRISARYSTLIDRAGAEPGGGERQLRVLFEGFHELAVSHNDETRILLRELLDNRRRAERAETWYLRPFLDSMVAMARDTPRWRGSDDDTVLAGTYQLLGAIIYFAVSEPTLTHMFGDRRHDRLAAVFPDQLAALVSAAVAAPISD